jgi:hypothetical protein
MWRSSRHRKPRTRGAFVEPTRGFEPQTPSLRVGPLGFGGLGQPRFQAVVLPDDRSASRPVSVELVAPVLPPVRGEATRLAGGPATAPQTRAAITNTSAHDRTPLLPARRGTGRGPALEYLAECLLGRSVWGPVVVCKVEVRDPEVGMPGGRSRGSSRAAARSRRSARARYDRSGRRPSGRSE